MDPDVIDLDYDLEVDLRLSEESDIDDAKSPLGTSREDELLADNDEGKDITEEKHELDTIDLRIASPKPSTSYSSGNREHGRNTKNENVGGARDKVISASTSSITFQRDETRITKAPRVAKKKSLKEKRDIVEYGDIDTDMDKSEEEISPPRKEKNTRGGFFDHDRPSVIPRRKKWNVDVREKVSLDDVIKMKEHLSKKDLFKPHRRSGSDLPSFRSQKIQEQNQEKLRQGLKSMVEGTSENVLKETEDAPGPTGAAGLESDIHSDQNASTSQFPLNWSDSWYYITHLINKGYNIYWALMKLKDDDGELSTDLRGRKYKCTVSYNDISGVAEAPFILQAKQGAAADFLKKFTEHFHMRGSFPTEVDEYILIEPKIVEKLVDLLNENRNGGGGEIYPVFKYFTDRKNHFVTHTCVLGICSKSFEGSSTGSAKAAKLIAGKHAYEELIGKPYPSVKIFQGEECTTSDSLYRGVESEIIHCYDFTRITMLEPGTVRQGTSTRFNKGTGQRGGRTILVSYEQPEKETFKE